MDYDNNLLVTMTVGDLRTLIKETVVEALKENNQKPTLKPSQKFVSRIEACNKLGVHESTLYRWTRDSRIRSRGVGSKVYYCLEDILNALQPLQS